MKKIIKSEVSIALDLLPMSQLPKII